ncbi:MAG TPA: hypothetical protein VFK02_28100 [Kofleriaceae bacterium]|nr:hypothetical protein [Kofleriaceae bacterium]
MLSARALTITVVALAWHGAAIAQEVDVAGEMHEAHGGMERTPLGIEDTRSASGTSWQPDSTPMFMWHARSGDWRLALHTSSFVGYDDTATERGDGQLLSINWVMGMATRSIGRGDLAFRAMLSAEPITMPDNGYPLLLQTGEDFEGARLHDRQHPHDLFMELAARYRQPIGDTLGIELYAAPVGEPAIGPPAFPHRFTSMANPLAPLGHHWFDSTHITFGVVTLGVFTRTFKLEGSWFNGREPDQVRTDLDLREPDSVAVRASANPTHDLSAQASWARLDSPDELETDVSVQRTTASLMWNRRLGDDVSDVAITAGFGQNNPSRGPSTHAALVEAISMFADTHTIFARAEALTKTGEELVLPMQLGDRRFGIGSFSAGYAYDFHQLGTIVPGIGAVGTLDVVGSTLGSVYGSRTPWGGMVFVRLRAPMMKMSGMHRDHAM